MSNSLFDQLKKSGLVNDKQARQTKQSQYQSQKQQKVKKGHAAPTDEVKRLAQQSQAEKIERDRLLNQQRKEEAERKAISAQIKQLIETNRIDNHNGEITYNFTDSSAVKRLYVNVAVHKDLTNGRLAIAKLDGRYELIPSAAANKIKERDASYIIACADKSATTPAEDDPYAAYQVPDDLMW